MTNHPTDQSEARAREALVRAFAYIDSVAGEINGIPNEGEREAADVLAGDLAEALNVPFDEFWPQAAADAFAFAARPAGEVEDNGRVLTAGERSIIHSAHMRSVNVVRTLQRPVGEVERLREALEPFTRQHIHKNEAGSSGILVPATVADVRRARAALQEPTR